MVAARRGLGSLTVLGAAASADHAEERTPPSHWKPVSTSSAVQLNTGFSFVTAVPYPGGYHFFFQKGARLVRCGERLDDDRDLPDRTSAAH